MPRWDFGGIAYDRYQPGAKSQTMPYRSLAADPGLRIYKGMKSSLFPTEIASLRRSYRGAPAIVMKRCDPFRRLF